MKQSGFSLLELLVALALLSVIGVGLAGAMQLGVNTYSRAQTLDGNAAEIASRAQLRRLLERATPPSLLTPFAKEFEGTVTSLSFVTLATPGFAHDASGLKVNILSENNILQYRFETFDDDGQTLESFLAPLANEVDKAAFGYFTQGTWQDTWNNQNNLPELVRIIVDGSSEPLWPEFTVKLIYVD